VPGQDSILADLGEREAWCSWKIWRSKHLNWSELFEGVDVVLHLAAEASPRAPWPRLCRDNIEATQRVIDRAAAHHVPRVVFASSNYVVKALEQQWAPACYTPAGPKIDSNCGPRPLTAYGISKAVGEVIGQALVDEKKLDSFVAVRIGAFSPTPPKDPLWRNLWISPRDIRSLLQRCIEAQFSGFHVVYGVSAEPTSPYDLSHTCELLAWHPRALSPSVSAGGGTKALA
jgi:hypothetical protein